MGSSGSVDAQSDELFTYLEGRSWEKTVWAMRKLWDKLDSDRSGFLEKGEITNFFKSILKSLKKKKAKFTKSDDELVKEWLDIFDSNHDGKLSWEEFQTGIVELFGKKEEKKPVPEPKKEEEKSSEEKSASRSESQYLPGTGDGSRVFKSKIEFGEKKAEDWDHFEMNPNIVGISKIVIRSGAWLDGIQVDYRLKDGTIWSSPIQGGSGGGGHETTLDDNEYIIVVDARCGDVINRISFRIEKRNPNGTTSSRVWGPFGGGGGKRFCFTGSVPILGFFGNCGKYWHSMGVYYSKKYRNVDDKLLTVETWDEAISKKLVSFYYIPMMETPGFSLPPMMETDNKKAEFLIEGFGELLKEDEKNQPIARYILSHDFRLGASPQVPYLLLQYDKESNVVSFQTDWVAPYYPTDYNTFDLEPGKRYPLFDEGSEYNGTFVACMEYIQNLIESRIGWDIKALKIIYCNDQNHRAYWKGRGENIIYVIESDRSTEDSIIKNDILDTEVLSKIFHEKYTKVMDNANTIWADKVTEYKNLDKSTLDQAKKNEYKEYFRNCKRQVQDALKLVDFDYMLYHDRWLKLATFKDMQEKNFHEIPDVESLSDEAITDLIIGRAAKDEQAFKDLLTHITDTINRPEQSILELCKALNLPPKFYHPINMMRQFILSELTNTQKVILRIGPLKTKERGLQKVIETKDKTTALLDGLRAMILCRDPVIPLIIIEYLSNEGKLTRVKNKSGPMEDYKCIHVNFTIGGEYRTIYELQIVFQQYYDLQKKDHDYYELLRVM